MRVRSVATHDVESITALSGQLGYPTSVKDVGRRLAAIRSQEGHGVFVAQAEDGSVAGWIHVFGAHRVESEPFAEIGGLVVAVTRRRSGVGRLLCERAQQWAIDRGLRAIRVRARSEREEAHRFYSGIGYSLAKAQQVFSKSLAGR